jgi:putative membrane protein insertion efficiency factor
MVWLPVNGQKHGIADPSSLIIKLEKPNPREHVKHGDSLYSNEYKMMLFGMFIFYKKFISSQDANSCSFTPSCSVYAVEAIEKQGLIMGWINFFDRFARCNGLSPGDYPIEENKKLLVDPVKDHHNTTLE